MSRFLFRLAACVDRDELEDAWTRSPSRRIERLWINRMDRRAILHACLLDDDPCAWWRESGGGCVYVYSKQEIAAARIFFMLHAELFERIVYDDDE